MVAKRVKEKPDAMIDFVAEAIRKSDYDRLKMMWTEIDENERIAYRINAKAALKAIQQWQAKHAVEVAAEVTTAAA